MGKEWKIARRTKKKRKQRNFRLFRLYESINHVKFMSGSFIFARQQPGALKCLGLVSLVAAMNVGLLAVRGSSPVSISLPPQNT